MMRGSFRIACALVSIWAQGAQAADPSATLTGAYGADGAAKILASAQTVLNAKSSPDEAPNNIALHCLAADALAPYLGARAVASVRDAADTLVAIDGTGDDVGWSIAPGHIDDECAVPGEQDILHRGCNAAGTKYTFRTALALTCVGRAYLLTHDAKYLNTAKAAVTSSWPHGAGPPGCPDCFYYWKSYAALDTGRYVRNTNALMGMALGAVYAAAKDPRVGERIRAIANSEKMELAAGNTGYFSIVDPQYRANPDRERARIENHTPYIAIADLDMGKTLGDESLVRDAARVEASWVDCPDTVCGGRTCHQWGADPARCDIKQQASVCFFRKASAEFADKCRAFVLRERDLDAYELWAVLSGV